MAKRDAIGHLPGPWVLKGLFCRDDEHLEARPVGHYESFAFWVELSFGPANEPGASLFGVWLVSAGEVAAIRREPFIALPVFDLALLRERIDALLDEANREPWPEHALAKKLAWEFECL